MNRKIITILAGAGTAAAFAANAAVWLHGGTSSAGRVCVSAAFIVLVSLLLYAWRRSNTAMCLMTVGAALLVIGAANGLLMTLGVMSDMIFMPFTVLLMPFFGVMQWISPTAAYEAVLAISALWLLAAVCFWISNRKSASKTE